MARVWDEFLTEQDQRHVAQVAPRTIGFGQRPALLFVDVYRAVFGDEPQPLMEALRDWPATAGLAAWEALEPMRRLLAAAREAGLPVAHVTGLAEEEAGPVIGRRRPRALDPSPDARDRRARRYDIMEQVAPVDGEVVLGKAAPSAFFATPLAAHFIGRGVDTVIVAGESTSGCVRATVVDAASLQFRVIVPEECVFDRHQAAHAINLFDMDRKYADVLPLEEVLGHLGQGVEAPVAERA